MSRAVVRRTSSSSFSTSSQWGELLEALEDAVHRAGGSERGHVLVARPRPRPRPHARPPKSDDALLQYENAENGAFFQLVRRDGVLRAGMPLHEVSMTGVERVCVEPSTGVTFSSSDGSTAYAFRFFPARPHRWQFSRATTEFLSAMLPHTVGVCFHRSSPGVVIPTKRETLGAAIRRHDLVHCTRDAVSKELDGFLGWCEATKP